MSAMWDVYHPAYPRVPIPLHPGELGPISRYVALQPVADPGSDASGVLTDQVDDAARARDETLARIRYRDATMSKEDRANSVDHRNDKALLSTQNTRLNVLTRELIATHPEDPAVLAQTGMTSLAQAREGLAALGITDEDALSPMIVRYAEPSGTVTGFIPGAVPATDTIVLSDWKGTPFAISFDVIAHELTHRAVLRSSDFRAEGPITSAISESIADTMAAALDGNWTLAEQITPGGLRTMANLTTISSFSDSSVYGHGNAAIPNSAAFLIGQELGFEAMGRIYARTIDAHLEARMTIPDFAAAVEVSARDLYGDDSPQVATVQKAWDFVLERGDYARSPGTDTVS